MVFGRTHALLAAATILKVSSASAGAPASEVTITKTVTNTHTICPATTKPPVCTPTNTPGGSGPGGYGPGNGGHGGSGSGKGPKEDADLWQSWLDKLSNNQAPHAPWHDWTKTATATGTGTGTGGHTGPTDLPPFDGECTKPGSGLPENKCNSPGSRSKWCDGKSIDTDYYKEYDSGKTCKYTLEITNTTLSYDAGPILSFAINGQSPGPVIECNWGDWVEIDVINKLTTNATTIHWHGIHHKGTNDQDGVPGVSECAVAPGQSRKYSWRASSYGTAWYHSHLLSQYGDGIRGPIIIHGPATADYDIDMGHVFISDTFPAGTAAAQADRIAHFGQAAVVTSNYLLNGNNKAVDLSTGKHALWKVQKGKKHLFRIINGAAQEAYSVHFDNHQFEVIAADFVPIKPYVTTWLNIAPGQRYDIVLKADQPSANYFLRAVTQTGCPSVPRNTGLSLANGIIQYADAQLTLPLNNFGNVTNATFATCNDEPLAKLVPYLEKTAGSAALFAAGQKSLPAGRVATPSANQSVVQWFINNNFMNVSYTEPTLQTLAENPNLLNGVESTNSTASVRNSIVLGQANQWVYFIVRNEFFAAHPLH
ncbi:Laccase, partial [Cyphellophora attinorum]